MIAMAVQVFSLFCGATGGRALPSHVAGRLSRIKARDATHFNLKLVVCEYVSL